LPFILGTGWGFFVGFLFGFDDFAGSIEPSFGSDCDGSAISNRAEGEDDYAFADFESAEDGDVVFVAFTEDDGSFFGFIFFVNDEDFVLLDGIVGDDNF